MKTEPNQWLRIYSQSIELAGGDENIKVLYFPMALETVPLAWFDKLQPNSMDTWEQLQCKFCENFCGVLTHPSTQIWLRTCKQKPDETFQEYYCRFTELRAQVYDITDMEVIEHFSNGIKYKWQFEKFYDNNPETAKALSALSRK